MTDEQIEKLRREAERYTDLANDEEWARMFHFAFDVLLLLSAYETMKATALRYKSQRDKKRIKT